MTGTTDTDERKAIPVVGIGASAGGLEALRQMFAGTTEMPDMAFVVVQHLDPTHESLMAQLIERYTTMDVKQAGGGETIEPNHVYVIPPAHGLAIEDGVLHLTEFKDPRGQRRPIDDFFESLAIERGGRAACAILSGTGADGSRGLRAIKEHGGLCVAQTPDTARYDGMPSSAIDTGLVDFIVPPGDIIETMRTFFARGEGPIRDRIKEEAEAVTDSVDRLCDTIQEVLGHDFSAYKRSTINRRVARRMQVLGIEDADEYVKRIRSDQAECEALFRDLLINVTRFFRDKEEFAALKTEIIEPMIERSRDGEELRVWVPGCSSGEEAYTIAMLIADACEKFGRRPYTQIFATDIDDKMLELARSAVYPLSALEDLPEDMRLKYTIGGTGSFTIAPRIRDMVRFSLHSLIRDPPYSKIELVSCRNLLIYFDDELQKQVVPLFHFALREGGTLFLGASEAIGRFDDLFETIDRKARLFRRRDVKSRYSIRLSKQIASKPRVRPTDEKDSGKIRENAVEIRALKRLADTYAPVSLLVDVEGMLLERWGAAGRYLDFPDRLEPNIHVPSLARPGLRELIGPMLRDVRQSGRRTVARDVTVETQFGRIETALLCEPLDEGAYLFVIRETGALDPFDPNEFQEFEAKESQLRFLEDELQDTRHRLRSTVEELETTNEELKSSNEEMMSMNEELQSTNEELTTVNDELKSKIDQLTVANSDLRNFFDSTELVVLVVDDKLELRSFTDAAKMLFPIDSAWIGRQLEDLPSKLAKSDYVKLAKDAAVYGRSSEFRAHFAEEGRHFIARAVPYRDADNEIEGATLVFTDVTESLSLENELREERERLRLALEVAQIGIWEYEPATDVTRLDDAERKLLNLKEGEGDTMEPILATMSTEDRDRINASLRRAMDGEHDFDETFRIPLDDGEVRWLHGLGRRVLDGEKRKFIGVTYDITRERAELEERELMIREMNHRVKNLFAVTAAMVSLSKREAEDIDSFAAALRNRIHALARSHSLTSRSGHGREATLRELVDIVLAPMLDEQKLSLDGQDVTIADSQLTSLALILHEWATNAAKYGALAVPDGAIEVRWSVDDENCLTLEWRETGGVPSDASVTGFGSNLITATARQLHGDVEAEKTETGFRRRLTYDLAATRLENGS